MTEGQTLLLSRLDRPKSTGPNQWEAFSPLREENSASLSITFDGDNILIFDHGDRDADARDILKAIGLDWPQILPPRKSEPSGQWTSYDYRDQDGKVVFQSVRIPCPPPKYKTFRQRRPNGSGGWVWDLEGTRLVLYCLPELLAADPSLTVYVCEGEKDVDRLRSMGLVATTNPMGAGKWSKVGKRRTDYAGYLRGRHVVVLPDNDEPGRKHGEDVARSLRGVAASVKVVMLPGLPIKGDVSDWLASGGTAEELHRLATAAPEQATIVDEPRSAPSIEADVVLPPGDYRFSESEVARRCGDIVRGGYLFAADEGQGYFFDDKRWVRDHAGLWILGKSLLVSRAYAEDGIRRGSNDPHFTTCMEIAKRYNGLAGRKRLIELVRAEPGIAILSSQFDADPWLFNVKNGTIHLRTGQLQPHSAADLITKLAPVEYDPAATRERWDSFIDEVIPDAEQRAHFKRVVGYFLTGEVHEHKLFFCYGTGANGKSVVFEVLLAAWGDYGTLAPVSLLTSKQVEQHPCDLNTLRGRRIALFAETPQGQRWDESRVKALTGGDTITARGMRENYSTFSPTAKFAIAGNYRLRTNDLSEGFRRRFEEMPFEVTIPEERRDPKLAEKLRAELPGVLSWALEGCMAWQRDGLGKSAKVIAATGAYFAENDRIAAFLAERCTFADGNRVSRAALRAAYVEWCEREGEHPINPRDFGEQLRQRGATEGSVRVAGAPVRGWQGVGLLDCGPVVTSKAQENGHVVTRSRQFPDNALEDVSREVIRETASTPDYVTTPADAPDLLATLGHCIRVRPGTTATDAEREALAEHSRGLNGTTEATSERLWTYWKADAAPTVAAFLEREKRRRPAP